MDQNELPLENHHLGVPSGASKKISKPMVRLAPTVHLSCTDTNSFQTDRNKIPYYPRHLGVPSSASKMISEPMVCPAQTMLNLASRLAPLGASITISDPMGRLAQTVHLSCSDTNNIYKWTETRFHMTHVT